MLLKKCLSAVTLLAATVLHSCTQDESIKLKDAQNDIVASIQLPSESRTAMGDAVNGAVGILWSSGDMIGVFNASGTSQKCYVKTDESANTDEAFFTVSGTDAFTNPVYAYYPYSADNDGESITSLIGNLPSEQTVDGKLHGDYKFGGITKSTSEGHKVVFQHIFSMARIVIDASNTPLSGDKLNSLTFAVSRDDAGVNIAGDFTFNAKNGEWTAGTDLQSQITMKWTDGTTISEALTCYASIFPSIKEGDLFTITVTTENYSAVFTATSKVDFASEEIYTFPVTLANFDTIKYYNKDGVEVDANGNIITPEPEVVTGTFTCATYNVDGLPKTISVISINDDGPGSDGTQNISSKIAQQGWDFVGFSEDFAYHTELTSALSGYTFGTHRGSVSSISSNNTDGLGFATNNTTCSFDDTESWTQFSSSYGGITSGANTCIKKGFRHYVVTMTDGVAVDVIITHMNTYSDSGSSHIKAQHAQLTQIAEYINTISANNRPIIFMGDTNCRYTRHDFSTYFWSKLNSDLTYADPWVTYQWAGVYPTYPSNSLMVSDATGTKDSDIICSTTQNGEVVDKIIYINKAGNPVQIKAQNYLRDYDNFNGLADHMPIVSTFEYTYTKN